MVISYLEKIRDRYQKELVELNFTLNEILSKQKENVEIIKILEVNNDSSFEAFTPRPVNSFNKKKISELQEEQKSIEVKKKQLDEKIQRVEKELSEVNEVIKVAKGCIF